MSLTREALSMISDQILAAAEPITPNPSALQLVPDSMSLHPLEKYASGRRRARGRMTTQSLTAFIDYVRGRTPVNRPIAACFVDAENLQATAIFNLGTLEQPGHGDDTAELHMRATAAFKSMQDMLNRGLSQQAVAEYLEDWSPLIEASSNGAPLPLPAAISGVRKMTIEASSQRDSVIGDFSASRSAMDAIEARSLETLPTQFILTTPPYDGLSAAQITLRLSVITGEKAPILKLRWAGEGLQRDAFANELAARLRDALTDCTDLHIGTYTQNP